jgi:hypothetical protein
MNQFVTKESVTMIPVSDELRESISNQSLGYDFDHSVIVDCTEFDWEVLVARTKHHWEKIENADEIVKQVKNLDTRFLIFYPDSNSKIWKKN